MGFLFEGAVALGEALLPAAAETAPAVAEAAAPDVLAAGGGELLGAAAAADALAGGSAADVAGAFGSADLAALEAGGGAAAADVGTAAVPEIAAGAGTAAGAGAGLGADALAGLQFAELGTSDAAPAIAGAAPADAMALPNAAGAGGTAPLATPGGGAIPSGGGPVPPSAVIGGEGGSLTDISSGDNLLTPITPPSPQTAANFLPQQGAPASGLGSAASSGTTPGLAGAAAKGGGLSAGGGGGGGFDWWKAAGLGLAAAPLGLTLYRGEQPLPAQSQQVQGLATGVGAAGNQLLQSAISNTPMPGQQAYLNVNQQQMVNQARQQLFNQGVQNPEADSRWPAMMANIQNQIAIQQQQFIQGNLDAALKATGQAAGGLTEVAKMQIAQDTAYTQAIANAGRSLGSVVGQAGTRLL